MDHFLAEVRLVLRPTGYLALCDIRRSSGIEKLDLSIATSDLEVLKRYEITEQVLDALDQVSSSRDSQITSVFPSLFRRAIRDFAAIKNTDVYSMLKKGEMKYLCYLLQKKPVW